MGRRCCMISGGMSNMRREYPTKRPEPGSRRGFWRSAVILRKKSGEIEEAIALHRDSGTEKRADLAGVLYRADKASRACFACQASSQCNWKAVKKNQEIQW